MSEALAPAVARRLHAHQPGIEPILQISFEDAVLYQNGLAGRRALVVDRQRSAPLKHRAVIDHGDPGGGDALADPASECRRALSVEIALEAVADRFVKQHARPARPEHDRHFPGRRRYRFKIGQRLGKG